MRRLAAEAPRARIAAEVAALGADALLVECGPLGVFCAPADRIPWTLQELGRLREMTFRAAGEGTGKPADVDLFDAYYLHLFVWDAGAEAIVGAYRIGRTDEILARYGKRGLYTQTLFDCDNALLAALDPALELGRSFVRPEYQRDFAPLLLLWRGIGRLVARAPKYAMLLGAVSISNRYTSASRCLIADTLQARCGHPELARHVRPRRPIDGSARAGAPPVPGRAGDLDELSERVARIEGDERGLPVLLRQYLKWGGHVLGFSRDQRFSDALDGLMMVDLRRAEPRILARYMGAADAAAFLAHHQAAVATRPAGPR